MCEKLLAGGAPGLHFYTLNQAEPSLAILQRAGTFALNRPAPSVTAAQ